jgi:hypothetical protein
MLKDGKNNSKFEGSVAPQAAAADVNGSEVDLKDFDSCTLFAYGDGTFVGTIKIQETDTSGSGYTDAAAADVIGTQDVAVDTTNVVRTLGYIGSKRYVRAVFTHTTTGDVSAAFKLGCAHLSPVSGN